MKPDWAAIEADFLATGMAYPALANKWGVPLSTLKKRAMRGGWSAKQAVIVAATETETHPDMETEPRVELEPSGSNEMMEPQELALELRADRAKRMIETTDRMMDHIIDALEIIKPDDTYALATLVRALKELREMQGLNKSALDIEEQRARIAKLNSEIRRDDEQSREPLVIEFVNTEGAEI